MSKDTRVKMTDLNVNLQCNLCTGYLIDATTISECLHSFCKSCIVRYLQTSKYCPTCDVQVHKTRPLLNIRSDKTLQTMVYKLVPDLFKNEMIRRQEFYRSNKQPAELMARLSKEDTGDVDIDMFTVFTSSEKISLCMQHTDRLPPYINNSSSSTPGPEDPDAHYRFLLLPASFTVGLLKKFIKAKYDLTDNYSVGIIHSKEILPDYFTVMDVADCYGWRRLVPLKLYFIIVDRNLLPQPPPKEVIEETSMVIKDNAESIKDNGKDVDDAIPSTSALTNGLPSMSDARPSTTSDDLDLPSTSSALPFTSYAVPSNVCHSNALLPNALHPNGHPVYYEDSVRSAALDTGMESVISAMDTGVESGIADMDTGIAAMAMVPNDDTTGDGVEIAVSECSEEQAMDLSTQRRRSRDRDNRGNSSVTEQRDNRDHSSITVNSNSTANSLSRKRKHESEDESADSSRNARFDHGDNNNKNTVRVQAEVHHDGYRTVTDETHSITNPLSVSSEVSETIDNKPSSPALDKTSSDDSMASKITKILAALEKDNKANTEEDNDEAMDKTNQSIDSLHSLHIVEEESEEAMANNTDNTESMDASAAADINKTSDNVLEENRNKNKVQKEEEEEERSEEDCSTSSDSDLPKLVIIEPQRNWKVEEPRCDSVHSDKENQSASPPATIVNIIPVNSNVPKVEQKSENKLDMIKPEVVKNDEAPPIQCSTVIVPVTSDAIPRPVYTILPPKQNPAPKTANKRPLPKLEHNLDNTVKRKRGRPPKVAKDPSVCTPPKIARILPKGMPPPPPVAGFFPQNGMNMQQQGQWGFPMQFPAQMQTQMQTLPNGQMVRVFVQNVQNVAAGQTGGQMMVNGQPQQFGGGTQGMMNMNMPQGMTGGSPQQFMNPQGMMNGGQMMNVAQQQFQMNAAATQQHLQQQQQGLSTINGHTMANMGLQGSSQLMQGNPHRPDGMNMKFENMKYENMNQTPIQTTTGGSMQDNSSNGGANSHNMSSIPVVNGGQQQQQQQQQNIPQLQHQQQHASSSQQQSVSQYPSTSTAGSAPVTSLAGQPGSSSSQSTQGQGHQGPQGQGHHQMAAAASGSITQQLPGGTVSHQMPVNRSHSMQQPQQQQQMSGLGTTTSVSYSTQSIQNPNNSVNNTGVPMRATGQSSILAASLSNKSPMGTHRFPFNNSQMSSRMNQRPRYMSTPINHNDRVPPPFNIINNPGTDRFKAEKQGSAVSSSSSSSSVTNTSAAGTGSPLLKSGAGSKSSSSSSSHSSGILASALAGKSVGSSLSSSASASSSSILTQTLRASVSSSVGAASPGSSPSSASASSSSSTGLNNGYDAPLELTTKKEPVQQQQQPALQKLASMQPPSLPSSSS